MEAALRVSHSLPPSGLEDELTVSYPHRMVGLSFYSLIS